jgi:hypothetical protein
VFQRIVSLVSSESVVGTHLKVVTESTMSVLNGVMLGRVLDPLISSFSASVSL